MSLLHRKNIRAYNYENSPCIRSVFNYKQDIGDIKALNLSAVYAAVNLISNSIATLPINVVQYEDNKRLNLKEHFVYHLFDDTIMTKFNTIKSMVVDLLLYGNGFAYIEKSGLKVSLIYIPKNNVTINYNPFNNDLSYTINYDKINKRVNKEDMIHIRDNAFDGVNGNGFFYYAKNTINIIKHTEKSVENFWSNDRRLSGILTTDAQRIDDEQRQQLMKTLYSTNLGDGTRTAILEAGMHYQAISTNAEESQMLETRIFNIQEVGRYFGISPIKLGELSHTQYGSVEQANIEYVQDAILPRVEIIENEFDKKLGLEKDYYINFDINVLLKSDKSTEANYITTLVNNGILTVNEGREILGYNSLEGGDKVIIPYTKIEDNTIAEQDKE